VLRGRLKLTQRRAGRELALAMVCACLHVEFARASADDAAPKTLAITSGLDLGPLTFNGDDGVTRPPNSSAEAGGLPVELEPLACSDARSPRYRWHVDLGFRIGLPRLEETRALLAKRLDIPLKLDLPDVFQRPRTPVEQRDDLALDAVQIGIGRRMNDWLRLNVHAGGTVGDQRKRQRAADLALNTNFSYVLLYADVTAELYPWGIPDERPFRDLWDRFRASRPFVVTGFEVAYLRADADGRLKLEPLTLYRDEIHVRDWLVDYLLGVGWEVPISTHWSFDLAGYYSFHFYRSAEYSGWNVLAALRYRF
jgi:hypothetical protein